MSFLDSLEKIMRKRFSFSENFEKISYLEFQEKIQKNEEFYIIFERDDCPACPVFLEKFNQVSGENNLSFFVIDTNELNSKQKYECKDKFNLEYVPTAIFIKSGFIISVCEYENI